MALVGDVLGRVDEHDAVGSGPAEEEPQRAQPSGLTERSFGEECLDVTGCGARPVGVGALGDQEAGEVANDGEVLHDGEIAAGSSPGLSGALLTGDQCVGEAGEGGAQRFGGLVDPMAAPRCEALGVVIEWKGQASIDEEVLQRAGQRCRGVPRWDALEEGLRVGRSRLGEDAAEPTDHQRRSADAVSGGGVVDEVGEPHRRLLQSGGDPFELAEQPVGVLLPARIAQTASHDEAQPPARPTGAVGFSRAMAPAAPNAVAGPDRSAALRACPSCHRGGIDRPRATFGG